MSRMVISDRRVGPWTVESVVFEEEELCVMVPVHGLVGNSVPTSPSGKERLVNWKRAVATAGKSARGLVRLSPRWLYAISAGFSFNQAAHGNQPLDVENFLKPSLDALAAGLFCDEEQDPRQIARYDYDDSNFRYLFVQRLEDAPARSEEGAGFVVSILKSNAQQIG